jgi:predicted metal-dependent enzyme (double-stranded beta helix superfamily)
MTIDQLPVTVPTVPTAALATIAAGLAAAMSPDALVLDPGSDRGYLRLLDTDVYEAWLIAWGPGGSLDLHDHGGSAGAVVVVHGELMERYTDRHRTLPLRTHRVRAHEALTIDPTRVHGVWNPGPASALSVHVYSPPLTTMTFYDPRLLTPIRTDRAEVA